MATDSRSVEYLIKAKEEFSKPLSELRKIINDVTKDIEKSLGGFEKQGQATAFLRGKIRELAAAQDELKRKSNLTESLERTQKQYIDNGRAVTKLNQQLGIFTASMTKAGPPTKAQLKTLKDLQKQYDRAKTSLAGTTAKMAELSQRASKSGINVNNLSQEWRELSANAESSRAQMDRLKKTLAGVETGTVKVGKSADKAAAGLVRMNKSSKQSLRIMQRLRGEVLALATAYIGIQGAIRGTAALFETQRKLDAARARFRVGFEGDDNKAANEIRFVRNEAERLGLQFETLVEEYSRFIVASTGAGLGLEHLRTIFVGMSVAATVNQLSNEELGGTFKALTQIISKGVVQAEELRGQLGDRLPGALLDFAKGMRLTTAELNTMLLKQELTSESLIDFARELIRKYAEELPAAIETPIAKFNRLQNAITDLKVEIIASGFVNELTSDLDSLSKTISSAEFREGARALGSALGGLIRLLVLVIKNFDTLGSVLGALLAAKIFSTLATGLVSLGGAFIAVRTAMVGAGAAGLLAVGPAGWITLMAAAVGGLAFAWLQFGDSVNEVDGILARARADKDRFFNPNVNPKTKLTNEEIDAQIKELNQLLAELEAKNGQFESATGSIISAFFGEDIEDVNRQIKGVRAELEDFIRLRRGLKSGLINRDGGEILKIGDDLFSIKELGAEIEGIVKKADTAFASINVELAERQANTLAERREALSAEYKKILDEVTTAEEAIQKRIADLQKAIDAGVGGENIVKRRQAQVLQEQAKLDQFQLFRGSVADLVGQKQIEEATKFAKEKLREISTEVSRELKRGADISAASIKQKFQSLRNELVAFGSETDFKLVDEAEIDEVLRFVKFQITAIGKEIIDGTKSAAGISVEEIRAKYAELRAEVSNFPAIDVGKVDDAEQRSLRSGAVAIEREINDVLRLRATLVENVRSGSADVVSQNQQVLEIEKEQNQKIRELVAGARAYASALGDEQLLANLDLIETRLDSINKVVLITGQEINEGLASGLTDAFDEFAEGTKGAKEAFRDFAHDFLRNIATMILQQAILSALQQGQGSGGGIGGIVASAVNAAFKHDGGMIGAAGGVNRMVPLSVFAGAARMHRGGAILPGLRADERPIIGLVGEEMLSRGDPRNSRNGGGGDTIFNVTTPDAHSFRRTRTQIEAEGAARLSDSARRNQ